MLFVFTAFFLVIQERSASFKQQQYYFEISFVSDLLVQEVRLAQQVRSGYRREFSLPSNVAGDEYAVHLVDGVELSIQRVAPVDGGGGEVGSLDEYVVFLPVNVTLDGAIDGEFSPGYLYAITKDVELLPDGNLSERIGFTCVDCDYVAPVVTCGDGVCGGIESCEWYGLANRQMLCDGMNSPIPVGGLCSDCAYTFHPFDARVMWPSAVGKELVYYNNEAKSYEIIINEPWAVGDVFTVHHLYTNDPDAPPWCERIDDVFTWADGQLVYNDTYNFYADSRLQITSPGHVWYDEKDTLGEANSVDNTRTTIAITHGKDCDVLSELPGIDEESTVRREVLNGTAAAEFTHDASVAVYLFNETTYFNKDPNDWFNEAWYFYYDVDHGWVPIVSKGYEKKGMLLPVNMLWDLELVAVRKS